MADIATETPESRAMSKALKARGFVSKRQAGTGRGGFAGIRLQRKDYTDDPRYGG